MRPPSFSAAGRPDVLDRLATRSYDLLVIGGGISGVGAALDAAARGLSVALVERDDLASGTSSKSSKLVHGGLRYLEHGDVAIVRESIVERELLQRLAPHLVQRQPFTVPDGDRRDGVMMGTALTIYGGLGGFRSVTQSKRLSPAALVDHVPGLARHLDHGGWTYSDCRTDDARLTMTVARIAARMGADIVTHADVTELRMVGGRVAGATVHDKLGGGDIGVAAHVTLSATGVWADRVRDLAGPSPIHLAPSKGVHLVFPADRVRTESAVIIPSGAHDHRRIFVIPWGNQVVVGTTDDRYEGALESPSVDADDADYCCAAVNDAFGLDLRPADAVGAWAGLRPLPRGDAKPGSRSDTLSRRHALLEDVPGLITLTGGKLTTYRKMAAEAVDVVMRDLGGKVASSTAGISLGLRGSFAAAVARAEGVCRALDIEPAFAAPVVERHGDEAVRLLQRAAETGEAQWLVPGLPYLRAELRWAVDEELALTVDDILRRRVRVALRDRAAGGAIAREAGVLLGKALGWGDGAITASVQEYRRRVSQERGVVPVTAR